MKLLKTVIGLIVVLGLAFFALKEMTGKPTAPITPEEPSAPSIPSTTIPSGWETSTNERVSVSYPSSLKTYQAMEPYFFLADNLVSLYTDAASYHPTNYSQDGRIVVSKEAIDEGKCYTAPDVGTDKTFGDEIAINGVEWKQLSVSDAGAGNRYESTIYCTFNTGVCYEIVQSLHYASDFTGIDNAAMETSQKEMRDVLKRVVATVTLK